MSVVSPSPAPLTRPAAGRLTGWRLRWHEIIYESDTPAGKAFDVALIVAIVASVGVVMLESVADIAAGWGPLLRVAEWTFTAAFTVEYIARLVCVGRPLSYAASFFGVVDLLAVLPTYLTILVPGAHYMMVIRLLRILRVFRVLKLTRFSSEGAALLIAMRASRHKVAVFLFTVLTLVTILGSLMYVIEGADNGFTSIPRSIYWAIVTVTTVGYGDIAPQTILGQALAACLMITGYGIIAVPTGIVTAELVHGRPVSGQACPQCVAEGHRRDAIHCYRCGAGL